MPDCEKWLRDFLNQQGMVSCEVIRAEAKKLGFKKAELKEARKALDVKCCNDWAANGETMNWFWYLEG